MRDTSQNNAMAEIALALAMGFFSIMVLTMVSMGGGVAKETAPALDAGVAVRPSAPSTNGKSATKDTLLIHYEGRFLDAALKPVDPAAVGAEGPLVLAVAPGLTFAAVLRARKRTAASDITVTTLDERWLATLKEKFQ
jgi:hypothetical protein